MGLIAAANMMPLKPAEEFLAADALLLVNLLRALIFVERLTVYMFDAYLL